MITATISDYLEIWPRVLSYMIGLNLFLLISLSLLFSLALFITWFTPKKQIQNHLKEGKPVLLYNFKGWLRCHFVIVSYFALGSFFLTPILSFIPIVFFDVRILIIHWEMLGIIVLFVLYKWKFHRYHKKIAFTKYYFKDQKLGFRSFNNDIIIPYQAIIASFKDNNLLRAVIEFQYQSRLLHRTKQTEYNFQFSTRETYDAFIYSFNEFTDFEWREKELETIKDSCTLSYGRIQFLNEASLKKELPERIKEILLQK